MKKFALVLALLSLAGAASAGAESIVFDNTTAASFNVGGYVVGGPSNGNLYSVDNSFTLTSSATINQVMVGVWVPAGSTLANAQGGIYSAPFAQGTAYDAGSVIPVVTHSEGSNGSWNLYEEIFDISNLPLGPGTYYLAFVSATTQQGNTTGAEVEWDVSGNPGTSADQWVTGNPSDHTTGLPSTTFALYGPGNSPVPEPSSLLLLGSGAAALFGAIRRRVKA